MSGDSARGSRLSPLAALVAGGVVGLGLVVAASLGSGPGSGHRVEIAINGLPARESRDLLLPSHGWTIQLALDPAPGAEPAPEIVLELREERTGRTAEIQDQLVAGDGFSTLTVPEALGLREGLLAVRARARFADGAVAEDWRRLRIRPFPGGPPIGTRQIVQLDFAVDRDGDGRADFEQDLASLGLATAERPGLARRVAAQVARRALARVERAYDAADDPNHTAGPSDRVAVRFQLEPVELESERAFTTRLCVGGRDPGSPGSVGHVRFDPGNARRASTECNGEEPAGLFPSELAIYRESALFGEVFGPFDAASGGRPIGSDPADADALAAGVDAAVGPSAPPTSATDSDRPPVSPPAPRASTRREQIERAIAVLGDALGTLLAHESGHALGLVAPGKPPVGLFGGERGEAYAHAVAAGNESKPALSLMDPGRGFRFEDLAGTGEAGELRFRPIDYAYLRDRVVLKDRTHAKAVSLE